MTKSTAGVLLRHIRRLVPGDLPEQGSDGDLLRRYATQRDEAAFAALVRRHGPLVWNACRRALRDRHDAEDAFQATFLVLAKKAGAVRWRESVAGWLYAVAWRLANKARCQAARRPRPAAVEPAVPDPIDALSARELLAALDEELAALPERYRGPAVLCWLEGRTQAEAARLLGLPYITLRRRLERGKQLLHARLTRRGLTLAVALAAPALADAAPAFTGAASPRAAELARLLLAPAVGKCRAALGVLAACLVAAGAGWAAFVPPQTERPVERAAVQPAGGEAKRIDALGDPLPAGAVLRLGTVRLRGESANSVAYSPDGKWLASGGWDKHIRLWDPATGQSARTITVPARGVWAIAFSGDSKILAGAGGDKVLYLWDPATGNEIGRLEGFTGELRQLALAPKGNLLLTGDTESVRLWDVAAKKLVRTLTAEKAEATAVAFAPDGRSVAAGLGDGTARVWDPAGKPLLTLKGHTGPINTLLFTPDGKHLVTFGPQTNYFWDRTTGKRLYALGGTRVSGTCTALSPDGKFLAYGAGDNAVRVWDWQNRREVLELPRHPDHVRSLAFSPDGRTLASVGDAAPVHLWDAATGRPKFSVPGHRERLLSAAYTPDGRAVVTCAWDGTARVWDARTGKELRRLDVIPAGEKNNVSRPPDTLGQVVVSPDGRQAAVARGDEVVVVCDLQSGKELRRYKGMCLAYSPDGKWVAVGGRGTSGKSFNVGVIRLYDRATGELRRELSGHLTPVVGLTFTADSQALISRGQVFFGARSGEVGESETRHLRVWDVATGRPRRAVAEGSYPSAQAVAPDGRTVAVLGRLGEGVALWETATGAQRGPLDGHKKTVFQTAFSPDGRTVATASMDGTVRLWDTYSRQEIGRLQGHRGWVLTVAFSPDGTHLVSGSLDTSALVWDVRRLTNRAVRTAEITGAELAACWEDLGLSAEKAYRAIGKLLAAPERAAAFLSGKLKPAPAAEAQRIAGLITDLGSDQFKVRERATLELEKLGEVAAPALHKALAGDLPLEVKRRLEVLADKVTNWPPDLLRQVRAVEVLEHAGTPAARAVLNRLANDGAPEARLTREARASLSRLR